MKINYTLRDGEESERIITTSDCLIGRSPRCDIVVDHIGMSRQHCQIEVVNGEVFVTDLGSTNGVFIEGERIEAHKKVSYATYLNLSFGPISNFQITIEDDAQEEPPPLRATPLHDTSDITKTRVISMPLELDRGTKKRTSGKDKAKKTIEKKKSDFPLLNILGILVLIGAVYWYIQRDSDVADSELPSVTETKKKIETF
jgi:pSer/pThr/pTyr-binding forkhead associated (FHA) protein